MESNVSDACLAYRIPPSVSYFKSIQLILYTAILAVCQTCHLVRIVRIQYGFWPFLKWYGCITLWYGFEANFWKTIYDMCIAKQNSFIIDTTSFSAKFPKNGRFRLPWSTIDLVNQRRRPNPTVTQCEVKLRFWFFAAVWRFLLHNVAIFLQTALRYESRERFRDTSMHKWRIGPTDWYRFSLKKYGFPTRNSGVSAYV